MKSKLKKALNANDMITARETIIEMLGERPVRRESLESVTLAIRSFPEIFADDDRLLEEVEAEDYSCELFEELRERLHANFSREKLSLFVEIAVSLSGTESEANRAVREKREKKEQKRKIKTERQEAVENPADNAQDNAQESVILIEKETIVEIEKEPV